MRTYKKSTLAKVIHRFDIELKKILLNDLKVVRAAKDTLVVNIKSMHKEIENHHWTVA
ncbi:MAG: hypothetical protein ACOH2A_10450 [Sphingobacteriaceae bacterium]